MQKVIGWDIGGAHVKAACVEGGRVTAVRQLPCPLWLGADRLGPGAADACRSGFGPADLHVVTMTGELADVFPDRRIGVLAITDALVRAFPNDRLRFYGGRRGVHRSGSWWPAMSKISPPRTGMRARRWPPDTATGCSSISVRPRPTSFRFAMAPSMRRAYTDAERMACGELVYTGLTRTFVMAMAPRAPFAGRWTTLAAEYFASAADVHRILGTLDEEPTRWTPPMVGRRRYAHSRARLARMIGHDAADASDADWFGLAAWFSEVQLRQMHDGALLVLSGAGLPADAPVIAAGSWRADRATLGRTAGAAMRAVRQPVRGRLESTGRMPARPPSRSRCWPRISRWRSGRGRLPSASPRLRVRRRPRSCRWRSPGRRFRIRPSRAAACPDG